MDFELVLDEKIEDGIIYEHTLEDETVTEEVSDEVRIVRGGY